MVTKLHPILAAALHPFAPHVEQIVESLPSVLCSVCSLAIMEPRERHCWECSEPVHAECSFASDPLTESADGRICNRCAPMQPERRQNRARMRTLRRIERTQGLCLCSLNWLHWGDTDASQADHCTATDCRCECHHPEIP